MTTPLNIGTRINRVHTAAPQVQHFNETSLEGATPLSVQLSEANTELPTKLYCLNIFEQGGRRLKLNPSMTRNNIPQNTEALRRSRM